MSKLFQARFATTVNDTHCLPATPLREVAFAGRSNAGKSSALNVLCNQKRLAFASKTPGRTQHINYFGIFAKDDLLGYLVDLPGYGYAQVPIAVRLQWQGLLEHYLKKAGFADGKYKGDPIFMPSTNSDPGKKMAEVMQAQLEKLAADTAQGHVARSTFVIPRVEVHERRADLVAEAAIRPRDTVRGVVAQHGHHVGWRAAAPFDLNQAEPA